MLRTTASVRERLRALADTMTSSSASDMERKLASTIVGKYSVVPRRRQPGDDVDARIYTLVVEASGKVLATLLSNIDANADGDRYLEVSGIDVDTLQRERIGSDTTKPQLVHGALLRIAVQDALLRTDPPPVYVSLVASTPSSAALSDEDMLEFQNAMLANGYFLEYSYESGGGEATYLQFKYGGGSRREDILKMLGTRARVPVGARARALDDGTASAPSGEVLGVRIRSAGALAHSSFFLPANAPRQRWLNLFAGDTSEGTYDILLVAPEKLKDVDDEALESDCLLCCEPLNKESGRAAFFARAAEQNRFALLGTWARRRATSNNQDADAPQALCNDERGFEVLHVQCLLAYAFKRLLDNNGLMSVCLNEPPVPNVVFRFDQLPLDTLASLVIATAEEDAERTAGRVYAALLGRYQARSAAPWAMDAVTRLLFLRDTNARPATIAPATWALRPEMLRGPFTRGGLLKAVQTDNAAEVTAMVTMGNVDPLDGPNGGAFGEAIRRNAANALRVMLPLLRGRANFDSAAAYVLAVDAGRWNVLVSVLAVLQVPLLDVQAVANNMTLLEYTTTNMPAFSQTLLDIEFFVDYLAAVRDDERARVMRSFLARVEASKVRIDWALAIIDSDDFDVAADNYEVIFEAMRKKWRPRVLEALVVGYDNTEAILRARDDTLLSATLSVDGYDGYKQLVVALAYGAQPRGLSDVQRRDILDHTVEALAALNDDRLAALLSEDYARALFALNPQGEEAVRMLAELEQKIKVTHTGFITADAFETRVLEPLVRRLDADDAVLYLADAYARHVDFGMTAANRERPITSKVRVRPEATWARRLMPRLLVEPAFLGRLSDGIASRVTSLPFAPLIAEAVRPKTYDEATSALQSPPAGAEVAALLVRAALHGRPFGDDKYAELMRIFYERGHWYRQRTDTPTAEWDTVRGDDRQKIDDYLGWFMPDDVGFTAFLAIWSVRTDTGELMRDFERENTWYYGIRIPAEKAAAVDAGEFTHFYAIAFADLSPADQESALEAFRAANPLPADAEPPASSPPRRRRRTQAPTRANARRRAPPALVGARARPHDALAGATLRTRLRALAEPTQ